KKGNKNMTVMLLTSILLSLVIGMVLVGDVGAYTTTLTKAADKNTACGGDIVTYTIEINTTYTISDISSCSCEDLSTTCPCTLPGHILTITDILPWGDANFVNSTFDGDPMNSSIQNRTWVVTIPGTGGTCVTSTCTAAAATVSNTLTIATKVSDNANGTYTNTPNCSDCTVVTTATTVVGKPILNISKGPELQNASPGDVISFTISVSKSLLDTSSCEAKNAYIVDKLDDRLEFVGADGWCNNGTLGPNIIDCGLGNISNGQNKSVTLNVRVKENTATGTIYNNANASADNADNATTLTPAMVSILELSPVLSVTKCIVVNDTACLSSFAVGAGDTVTFRVNVTSVG
ncbi:MAG: hypothetical protein CVT88_10330, partial [Candidatus Altiarchaeales archaeon HGW-Altiarchaeales-1]